MSAPSTAAQGTWKGIQHWPALVLVSVLVVLPFLTTTYLPLNDYPFHLARIVILSDLDAYSQAGFYEWGNLLLPNLAMDLVALPLAIIVGPEAASRIFAALAVLSMLSGVMALHHAVHRRLYPWPLLGVAFLFNGIFRFGFLNYLFGVGVAFLASALWIRMRPGTARLAVAFLLSLGLVLLHFQAFAVFAVIALSVELHAAWSRRAVGAWTSIRALMISALPFLFAVVLFALASPTAGDAALDDVRPSIDLLHKGLTGVFSLTTLIVWLDVLVAAVLGGLLALLLWKKQIHASSALLFASAMMLLAYLVLPGSFMGSHFVYQRLGPVIALLLVASLDLNAESQSARRLTAVAACSLALVICLAHVRVWQQYETRISPMVQALGQTEERSVIFAATAEPYTRLIADSADRLAPWQPPLKHVASYAVLAGVRFVPMTFADPHKQPLSVQAGYRSIKQFQGDNPRKTFTGEALLGLIDDIRLHRHGGEWPPMEDVYVFVVGFDRLAADLANESVPHGFTVTLQQDNFALLKLQ